MKTLKMRIPLLFIGCLLVAVALPSASFGCSLSVTNDAAIGGSAYGLKVQMTDQNNCFVQDDSPNAEKDYYVTFNLRNNLSMAPGTAHILFRARTPGVPAVFLAQAVRDFGGNYVIYVVGYHDNGAFTPALAEFITTQHRITLEWHAASAPGANDGSLRLYKGGNLRGEITNIDNDQLQVDFVQLGAFGGIDATTTGEMHFDEFVSTRTPQF